MVLAKKELMACLGYGKYLGISKKKSSFVLYENKKITKKLPFHKCNMILFSDGNNISSSALFYAGIYDIPTVLMSQTGRIISTLRHTNSDFDVDLRRKQYEAYNTPKGVSIAKFILQAKIENQIEFLDKYGLNSSRMQFHLSRVRAVKGKKIDDVRSELVMIEANCSKVYFHEYVKSFDEEYVTQRRYKRNAQDIFNNVLNLSYEILKIECFRACYLTHLDPFLGYLHSSKHGKPAMVCDLQELFRTRVDEFIFKNRKKIHFDDFQDVNGRAFLSRKSSLELILMLNDLFSKKFKTKEKFGISSQYELRTLVKYQARIIGGCLGGKELKII